MKTFTVVLILLVVCFVAFRSLYKELKGCGDNRCSQEGCGCHGCEKK